MIRIKKEWVMTTSKTTHVRVEKILKGKAKIELPEFNDNEIYKTGYYTLKGINAGGRIIYGKKFWDKTFKR